MRWGQVSNKSVSVKLLWQSHIYICMKLELYLVCKWTGVTSCYEGGDHQLWSRCCCMIQGVSYRWLTKAESEMARITAPWYWKKKVIASIPADRQGNTQHGRHASIFWGLDCWVKHSGSNSLAPIDQALYFNTLTVEINHVTCVREVMITCAGVVYVCMRHTVQLWTGIQLHQPIGVLFLLLEWTTALRPVSEWTCFRQVSKWPSICISASNQ